MSEYQRKHRNLNYFSPRCKEYLRTDFSYECAYCKTNEAESISGQKLYEIDHFKPQDQFSEDSNLHEYNNLFYSCSICNGKSGKSNKWSTNLLNPCEDKIYSGKLHVVYPKDDIDNFKLTPNSEKGKLFIETFNLNQYDHREIRKKRWELQQRKNEKMLLIRDIGNTLTLLKGNSTVEAIKDSLIDKIDKLKNDIEDIENSFSISEDVGHTVFKERLGSFVSLNHINEDYNIDYEFIYKGIHIKCTLLKDEDIKFTCGKKMKRIDIRDAEIWKNNDNKIIAFLVDLSRRKIYYCDIKKVLENTELDDTKKTFTVSIDENNEVNEKNIQKFLNDIVI